MAPTFKKAFDRAKRQAALKVYAARGAIKRKLGGSKKAAAQERVLRPITKSHAEPVLRKCALAVGRSRLDERARMHMLDKLEKYKRFYANARGDVVGVQSSERTVSRRKVVEIKVDIIKPDMIPERYGTALLFRGKETVNIDWVGHGHNIRDEPGRVTGLMRIALDTALSLRKPRQSITVSPKNKELAQYYRHYGFRFKGLHGELSAAAIEHKAG